MRKKKRWVGARAVRARFNDCSDMTLWRWLNNPALGFPKPVYHGRLRFWDEEELDAYDEKLKASAEGKAA
jgi:predicted DNA-binding transcriptional regulator AlpA